VAELHWIWLAEIFKTGSIKTDELLDVFGSAEAVYEASPDDYRGLKYLTETDYDRLCDKSLDEAKSISRYCAEKGYRILTLASSDYPEKLRDIPSRPILLYLDGVLPNADTVPFFAVVGTRKATPYGAKVASLVSMGAAQAGGVVISGMAEGIDTFAHKGALRGNGKTVAVLGCGLDVCYPRSNLPLRQSIPKNGCVISEQSPKTNPAKYAFPIRNRLISGFSEATVVVEAGIKSGSLITATCAAEQGRTVYAVPGNIDRSESAGPNRLLMDGARPLITVRQLIADTLPLYPHVLRLSALNNTSLLDAAQSAEGALLDEIKHRPAPNGDVQASLFEEEDLQTKIYRLIRQKSPNLNELAAACRVPAYRVFAEVTALERKKAIELLPTGRFITKE